MAMYKTSAKQQQPTVLFKVYLEVSINLNAD
jgi:hypothetical protein